MKLKGGFMDLFLDAWNSVGVAWNNMFQQGEVGFFSEKYLDNPLWLWLLVVGLSLTVFIMGGFFLRRIEGRFKKFTAKTKTQLDDILFEILKKPLIWLVRIVPIKLLTDILTLNDELQGFINFIYDTAIIVIGLSIVYKVLMTGFDKWGKSYVESTDSDLDDQLLPLFRKIVRGLIFATAAVMIADKFGIDLSVLLASLGIGAFAIGFALQTIVANIFAGLMLYIYRLFSIGDRIEVDGYDGTVVAIGFQRTKLKDLSGRDVDIPNKTFMDNPVVNISSEEYRKIAVEIGLEYDTTSEQIREVDALLRKLDAESEFTHEDKKAYVGYSQFGPSSKDFKFIYYIDRRGPEPKDIEKGSFDMMVAIDEKFADAGYSMAFPTREIKVSGGLTLKQAMKQGATA